MFRIGTIRSGEKRVAVVEAGGEVYDLSSVLGQPVASLDALFDEWDANLDRIAGALESGSHAPVDIAAATFDCPIASPRKVICIGINYRDHIDEMSVDAPEFPYAFLRPPSCLTGHGADVVLPDGPNMIDWEAELGVVVGKRARGLSPDNALEAVAGYTVINDISARDWIESAPFVGVDWVMQKAWDGFQPTGPWLVPARFVEQPQALAIKLSVNGVVKQDQTTANMVFSVAEILVHLSRIMTLEAGDLIATGTPSGVGFGRKPREFLQNGDEVTVSIEGLGELRNRFRRAC